MAPIQFLIPLFASVLQAGLGGALAENARAREANEQRAMLRQRREQLQPLIDRLREAKDYFDLDEQFTRDFSRASNQLTAQAASTGMTNAGTGGLDNVRSDLLAAGLAQLAQAKQQDEARRQELLAQLLSDVSLYGGTPDENVASATLLGGLLGGVQGVGSNLASYFSTDKGMERLAEYLGGGGAAPSVVSDNAVIERAPATTASSWSPSYPDDLGLAASPLAARPRISAPRGLGTTNAMYYNLGLGR